MYVITFSSSSSSVKSILSGGTDISGRKDLGISLLSRESTAALAPKDGTWSRLKRKASMSPGIFGFCFGQARRRPLFGVGLLGIPESVSSFASNDREEVLQAVLIESCLSANNGIPSSLERHPTAYSDS
ncbi:hypothetical protein PoB_002901300 [Plakobranchus ocellatus]|uniref:Uncharacterized protein n=1 Tax=Plakobranchus ocellatus TaxID=259542 RepID=A0AAV4A722_9GAST|nr:hypothetical protein PoB_002901300 [Plakobranchus ocellatus]